MILRYIGQSFKRGCIQLVRRPMYFLLIVIMPLLSAWFLLDLIKDGSVQREIATASCRARCHAR
mgnify:CR=1 FL=1